MPPASAAASGTRSITAKSPRQAPSSNRTGPGYAHVTSTSTSTPGSGRLGQGRRRHRKVLKDTIQAVTKGDIRRLARRGGVKRISAGIYNEARAAMKDFMIKVSLIGSLSLLSVFPLSSFSSHTLLFLSLLLYGPHGV